MGLEGTQEQTHGYTAMVPDFSKDSQGPALLLGWPGQSLVCCRWASPCYRKRESLRSGPPVLVSYRPTDVSSYTALCFDPVLVCVLGPGMSRTQWTGTALLPVTLTPTPIDLQTLWGQSPVSSG